MEYKEILSEASKKVGNDAILINLLSKRVRQLNHGSSPLIKSRDRDPMKIALREIIEGKITSRERSEKSAKVSL